MLNKTVCDCEFECGGNCWLNAAGSWEVWEIVSKHCNGTGEERNLIEDVFNSVNSKEEISNKYGFTKEEKDIVEGDWFE